MRRLVSLTAPAHRPTGCRSAAGRRSCLPCGSSGWRGDGIVDLDEACDDANTMDDDGCDADCVPSAVVHVATGFNHTCVLTRAGGVRCWGSAWRGALGYGNTDNIGDDENPSVAGSVDIGGRAVALAAGFEATCAVLDDGSVRCWGWAMGGQLGYGNSDDIGDDETPASAGDIPIGSNVVAVSFGFGYVCALQDNAAVQCWGQGGDGVLGYGNETTIGDGFAADHFGDVVVGGDVVQVDAGGEHTCVLLDSEAVRCWGNGEYGVLGYGNSESIGDDELPISVAYVDVGGSVVEIAAGSGHTCARLDDGAVRCWGGNYIGALGLGYVTVVGDDETPSSVDPVDVGGTVAQLDAGGGHMCALLDTGDVRCWGDGARGKLGHGNVDIIGDDEVPASVGPVDVGGVVVQVSAGSFHTCVVLDSGAVRCWGDGMLGMLGYGNESDIGDDEVPSTVGDVEVF